MTTDIQALLVGDSAFPFHDVTELGPHIESALASEGIGVETTTDREALTTLSRADNDVLIDYTTASDLTEAQRAGLRSFVEGGGGYVGVHAAAALETTVPDDPDAVVGEREAPDPLLRNLIGGQFVDHPEPTDFAVRIVDTHHPITAELDDFRVYDEPYRVEVDDDVHVLARMDHADLGDMPVAWAKSVGDGRSFYTALGHTSRSFEDGPLALLAAGIRWAARV